MSNTAFDKRPKDHSSNGSSNNHKMEKQNIGVYNTTKPVIQNPPGGQQPVGMRATAMPESYVSGPYYQTTNAAGFPLSFPTFNQATWSTGSNNQPYEHNNFGFGAINAGAPAPSENQYVTADHLFNQSNPGYSTTYSGAYLNGNNVGSWSYFNSPNSFFFPTGNGDLNLTWGQQEAAQSNQLLPDIYKGAMQQPHDMDGVPLVTSVSAVDGQVQNIPNGDPSAGVEKQLSGLSISPEGESPRSNEEDAHLHAGSGAAPAQTQANHGQMSNAPSKPISWAAVAKQPAKPKPNNSNRPQPKSASHAQSKSYSQQNGSVNGKSNGRSQQQGPASGRLVRQSQNVENGKYPDGPLTKDSSPLLKKLWTENNYNPKEFTFNSKDARVFIIKSYSEDDIFRSIKYSIWTSTEHGNRRLNEAYKEQQKNGQSPIYLLFSVNGSGHFCGIAVMTSEVDCSVETGIWVQDKWKGRFGVKWLYVKDVPNMSLRHIRLENNENKPVTNSRDTQEVPLDKAKQVLKIIHSYKAQTSIFDDFSHYEKRQLEDAKARGRDLNEADSL